MTRLTDELRALESETFEIEDVETSEQMMRGYIQATTTCSCACSCSSSASDATSTSCTCSCTCDHTPQAVG